MSSRSWRPGVSISPESGDSGCRPRCRPSFLWTRRERPLPQPCSGAIPGLKRPVPPSWISGGGNATTRETGVVLDGRYIAPMYTWSRSQHRLGSGCRWILSAKDFLHFWLTGRACTDPSTASGFGLYSITSGAWSEALCQEADLDPACLPAIVPSGAQGGLLSSEAASLLGLTPGIPVACGAADSVAAVLGMGVSRPGQVCQMAGSSTATIAVAGSPILDPEHRYLVTPLAEPRTYGFEADILASGISLEWLANLCLPHGGEGSSEDLACRMKDLSASASQVAPGAEGLFFFPYLAGGEQSVLWDPEPLWGQCPGSRPNTGFRTWPGRSTKASASRRDGASRLLPSRANS